MNVIRPSDWTDMPWHNGGGVTSEICRNDHNGHLAWRISTAIVSTDDAYSIFPGCTRISTVIEGAGTDVIDCDTGQRIVAAPFAPVTLNGDHQYRGQLRDGPIRFFNVIFDPRSTAAKVALLDLARDAAQPLSATHLFCIAGRIVVAGQITLSPFDLQTGHEPGMLVTTQGRALGLLITLRRVAA